MERSKHFTIIHAAATYGDGGLGRKHVRQVHPLTGDVQCMHCGAAWPDANVVCSGCGLSANVGWTWPPNGELSK